MPKPSILIVEDEAIIGLDIENILRSLDYRVLGVVPTGAEAVQKAEEWKPDLILMDIVLVGDMDGIQAARAIKNRFNIPILYLTANADLSTVERARDTEPFGYILKPVDERTLFSNIDSALNKFRIEQQLQESREQYRRLIEDITDALYSTDENQIFTFISPVIKDICSLEPDQFIGHRVSDFILPEDRPLFDEFVKRLRSGEKIIQDFRMNIKPGSVAWFRISSRPLFIGNRFQGDRGIVRDITKMKEAEETLHKREERLRFITDNMMDLIAQIDANFILRFVTPSILPILGYQIDELLDKPVLDYIHPEDIGSVMTEADKAIVSKKSLIHLEYRLRHRKGHYRWMASNIHVHFTEDGKFESAIFGTRDITERKTTEEALLESEKKYRHLVDYSLTGIYITQHHILKFCNQRFCDIFGYANPKEMIGKHVRNLVAPESWDTVNREVSLRESGQKKDTRYTFKVRRADGKTIHVEALGGLIEYEGQPAIHGTMLDITDRITAESDIRDREARLASILRAAPIGMGVVTNRVLQEVNSMLCSMTGYTPEELIGKSARILYPDRESYEYVGNEKYRQIAKYGIGTVETHWRRKDGTVIDVLLSSSPIVPGDLGKGVTFTALDISQRKRDERTLNHHFAWEKLITLISTQLLSLAPDKADKTIGRILRDVCQFTGVDRGYIFEMSEDEAALNCLSVWAKSRKDTPKTLLQNLLTHGILWYVKKLKKFQIVHIPDVSRFGSRSSPEKRYLQSQGIRSFLAIPITSKDSLMGFMGFDSLHSPKTWTDKDLTVMRELGNIFAYVLERKKTESTLERREAMYRSLVEQSGTPVGVTDTEGQIVIVNQALCAMLGHPKEKILGQSFWVFVHPDDRNRIMESFLKSFTSPSGRNTIVFRFLRKDGRIIHCQTRPTVLRYGEVLAGFSAIIQDVTEQKEAEKELKESESKYRIFVENALEGIMAIDKNRRITFVNRRMAEMFGYEPEEIIGKLIDSFLSPGDLTDHRRKIQNRKNGKAERYRRKMIRKDGSEAIFQVSASPLYDEKGNYAGSFAMFTEVKEDQPTEKKPPQTRPVSAPAAKKSRPAPEPSKKRKTPRK